MSDPIDFGKQIGALIREAVEPLRKQIEELKAEVEAVRAMKAEPGAPGKDADEVDTGAIADAVLRQLLDSDRLATVADLAATEAVAKHFEDNPVTNGKDADPEVIRQMVKDAVSSIPAPKDGRDADPVSDDQVAAQVTKYLQSNPPQKGEDGVGLAGAMIDRSGALIITTTKGQVIDLGKVVGEDGKDGISFETVSGEYEVERGFVLRVGHGERVKELVLPYMVNRGFWTAGVKTLAGQNITHDGALWIAKRDTCAEPTLANSADWQLAARKGRDGKDGRSVKVPMQPVKLGDGNG